MPEVQFETWTTDDLAGQCRMQARELLDPEHSAFMLAVSARLTALATAVARARREALEEAAEVADAEEMVRSVGGQSRLAGDAIRALAATPPEARQTETEWKPPAGWKLVPEEASDEMLNAPLPPRSSVTEARYESRRDLRPIIYRAMLSAAPPPTAIGNLEGEGRS